MHPYVLATYLASIFTFLIGFFVLSRNHQNIVYILYFTYSLSISGWAFLSATHMNTENYYLALVSARAMHLFSISIPVLFFKFVTEFLQSKSRSIRYLNAFGFASALILVALTLPTKLMVADVAPDLGLPHLLQPGPLYPVVILHFLFFVTAGLFVMYAALRADPAKKRSDIRYLFWGCLIGYPFGASAFFIVYDIEMFPYPYGSYGIVAYVLLTAYAIVKHRLLDIQVIIKKTLIFSGLFAFVLGVLVGVAFFLERFLSETLGIYQWISWMLGISVVVLAYDRLRRWLVHVTENVLFQKAIDYDQIDREVADQIQITDLATQLQNIVAILSRGFSVDRAGIWIWNEEAEQYELAYGMEMFGKADAVMRADKRMETILKVPQDVTLRKEIFSEGDFRELLIWMEEWRAEVLCRIRFKEEIIAILMLGHKKSDEEYTQRDMEFLARISKGLGVSIQNAMTFKMKESYYMLMADKGKAEVLASLSAGMDHEIKNPLNTIQLAAQRMERLVERVRQDMSQEGLEKVGEYVGTIMGNVERIAGVVTRLKHFTKPMKDGSGLQLERLQLREYVEEAIELVSRRKMREEGIEIENHIGEEVHIMGDRASIVQIFWNLVVNACHAIDRNGRIEVSITDQDERRVTVALKDTGKGIPAENLDKIFLPFFTTKPTNPVEGGRERFGGTGLGLSYVKHYMEAMGGSITCESTVSKGTTFCLTFVRG